ncbi:MAG: hypothetical protein QG593_151 [Patescibacteria group bacterium]|nr:hypothetical protein [Patescibacteria group bacterium]
MEIYQFYVDNKKYATIHSIKFINNIYGATGSNTICQREHFNQKNDTQKRTMALELE